MAWKARRSDESKSAEPDPAEGPEAAAGTEGLLYGTTLGSGDEGSWNVETAAEIYLSPASRPRQIGPYKILNVLGKGGMGVVYRALQQEPIERHVALKLLRPGDGSPQAAVRFATECRVLARMHHPGIAQVFDAGTTEEEQPYLVMELVDGESLHRYCRRRRLGLRDRLALMIQVCRAVNHAHQQGVIHRDLKPSNVLVVEEGGEVQPKVIDFGIAKALDAVWEPGDALTRTDLVLGTPAYMSPEQARQATADTRSDVYSLGCLLFQLLVDQPPFSAPSVLEMFRKITDEPAPRPSVRLRDQIDGPFTAGDLGDLDWITLKALEKDPEDRYASAKELADDLQRFLELRPVLARAPTAAYQLGKLFRRHRGTMVAAGSVVLALLLGTLGTTLGLVRSVEAEANAEREARTARAVNRFLNDMLGSADPDRRGRDVRVVEVLDQAAADLDATLAEDPAVAAEVRRTLSNTYLALGELDKAEAQVEAAYVLYRDTFGENARETLSTAGHRLAVQRARGREEGMLEDLRELVARDREVLGENDRETHRAEIQLAQLLDHQGAVEEAAALLDRVVSALEAEDPVDLERLTSASTIRGWVLLDQGRAADAETLARKWLDRLEDKPQRRFHFYYILAAALSAQGDLTGAEATLRSLLAVQVPLLGEEHPETLDAVHNLATNLVQQYRLEEAEPMVRRTLEIRRRVLGEEHFKTLSTLYALSTLVNSRDESSPEETIALAAEVHRRMVASLGAEHPFSLAALDNHALTLLIAGRVAEAAPRAEELRRVAEETLEEGARWRLWAWQRHLQVLARQGHYPAVVEEATALVAAWEARGGADEPYALEVQGLKVEAQIGLGAVAAARETFDRAAARLERVLARDPAAAWQGGPNVAEAAYLLGEREKARSIVSALRRTAEFPGQVRYGLWRRWQRFFAEHPELEDAALLAWLEGGARGEFREAPEPALGP